MSALRTRVHPAAQWAIDARLTSPGESGTDRACVPHGQDCPRCRRPLDCLDDYIGGGSHYWHLDCPLCKLEFTYDTYRSELCIWFRRAL